MAKTEVSIGSTESSPQTNVVEKRSDPELFEGADSRARATSAAGSEVILRRHGTLDLDPMPTNDIRDPLNWGEFKKTYHLLLIAFGAMLTLFMAGGIISAYEAMAIAYNRSMTQIPYLTSVQIIIFGVVPFFWFPVMNKYGRRPVLMLCALLSGASNLGGAYAKTYGQQMATRALSAAFLAPYGSVGGVVVAEIYFANQRSSRNGVWALLLTVGPSVGPFLMGFVVEHAGFKWMYITFAVSNFALFLGWLIADETLYLRHELDGPGVKGFLGIITKTSYKFSWNRDVVGPFRRCLDYRVLLTSISYAVVFVYANVALTVEMPSIFGAKFHFNAQQIGLQFLGIIIGGLIGELLAGRASDLWMDWCIKRRGGKKVIEDRLWLLYPGFAVVIIGLMIWGVYLERAKEGHWIVTPLVGAGLAAGGCQIVTTASITYTIDVDYTKAVETGLIVTFIRQTMGFIGPFYFPHLFGNLGLQGGAGLMCGLIAAASVIPMICIHVIGLSRAKRFA